MAFSTSSVDPVFENGDNSASCLEAQQGQGSIFMGNLQCFIKVVNRRTSAITLPLLHTPEKTKAFEFTQTLDLNRSDVLND